MSTRREAIAALEHAQWAMWATSILDSEGVTPKRAERWRRLIATTYEDLTEDEKEAVRIWADRILALPEDRGELAATPITEQLCGCGHMRKNHETLRPRSCGLCACDAFTHPAPPSGGSAQEVERSGEKRPNKTPPSHAGSPVEAGGEDGFVEEHIRGLTWHDVTSGDVKTLVAGNLRHFAGRLTEHLDRQYLKKLAGFTKEIARLRSQQDSEPLGSSHPGEAFVCSDCGFGVKADEDGCCVHCGRDCTVEKATYTVHPAGSTARPQDTALREALSQFAKAYADLPVDFGADARPDDYELYVISEQYGWGDRRRKTFVTLTLGALRTALREAQGDTAK